MKQRIKLTITLLIVVASAGAQTVKEDLIRINQAYASLQKLHIQVAYRYYEEGQQTASDVQEGTIIRDGSYTYHKISNAETITQDSLKLVIDHGHKVMVLASDKRQTPDVSLISPEIENSLKRCTRLETISTKTSKGYTFWLEKETLDWLSITYNRSTYRLETIVLHYPTYNMNGVQRKDVKLEIEYNYPSADATLIPLEKFVIASDGVYRTTDPFRSYELIDYTSLARNYSN